jgi:hypothetical protein
VHRPGRAHSNVYPLSRLLRLPNFISPAREDLPSPSVSTKHEQLQEAWETFIKEHKLITEVKTVSVCPKARAVAKATDKSEPQILLTPEIDNNKTSNHVRPSATHAPIEEGIAQRFKEGYCTDKDFALLVEQTLNEEPHEKKSCAYHLVDNGLLYFKDVEGNIRLCVPSEEQLVILKEAHDAAHETAHARWECTLAALRNRFYWPSLCRDVTTYVHTCDPCQKIKHSHGPGIGYLQPLEVPSKPFNTISLDFITALPESDQKNAILVTVDKLTKFVLFTVTTTEVTAMQTANLRFQRLVKLFGLPSTIVGD